MSKQAKWGKGGHEILGQVSTRIGKVTYFGLK